MSSKVRQPDETAGVQALVWRRMRATGPASDGADAEEPPDSRARRAQLQQQQEQRVREAHAAGLREGETAGRNRAAAELQPVIDRLARSIEEIGGLRTRLRAEAEADLVQLSLAIARRVLRRELAVDPEALHGLVLGALEKLSGQEISRVRVHPGHVALVTASLRQNSASAKVEVISDPSRQVGTVIFETQHGSLDASVDSQLQEIERGLADRLRRQS
ncbi:MAG: FliH/SctL family protein [Candidatus Solibacter sp.]|nr:FliH/SctL family protein [Candidatus Solibacter sp.]